MVDKELSFDVSVIFERLHKEMRVTGPKNIRPEDAIRIISGSLNQRSLVMSLGSLKKGSEIRILTEKMIFPNGDQNKIIGFETLDT